MVVSETRAALQALSPSYQVSVCVAWSPDAIDGRAYDYLGLGHAADVIYVMDYDTRSAVFDQCVASANAPFPGMVQGLQRFMDVGLKPEQLVLGVPWYGYRYPCEKGTPRDSKYCPIPFHPWREYNCTDAAGQEISYTNITSQDTTGGPWWDANMQAAFFNVEQGGRVFQYWFDNATSTSLKYAYAKKLGLRGVGPYAFNDLDLAPASAEMWNSLDAFFQES